jgi:hypothetical protein
MCKVGDLVEFIHGKHGAQIKRMGLYAEKGSYGFDKVLHDGKVYWVNTNHVSAISMTRKDPVSETADN